MWNWDYTNVDNAFFKKWSPELAYIIGLFVADGHISNYECGGKKNVSFSNQTIDRDMLVKVADVCGYKNKVLDFKCGMSRIQFAGDFIWQFFTDLGFDNNKTRFVDIPKQLLNRQDLYGHFIRGVFDGDGSVCVRKRRIYVYPDCNIVGHFNTINFIKNIYNCYNRFYPFSTIYRVDYSGENAVKFLNVIYKDSTIHMDRKYKKFLSIKNWKTTCRRWTKEEKNFVIKNYIKMHAKDISEKLNRSSQAVSDCANRLGIKRLHSNGKI